jgi:hypothetical protein
VKTAWISDDVLKWTPQTESGVFLDVRNTQRSYDHLFRAEHFLNSPGQTSAADRADCISNLRKCLTHRLHLFERIYNLRGLASVGKKHSYLTILAEFGVVRPFLLQRLLRVRNAIEYRDVIPPSAARCGEFIDVTWYFLRSTDSLLSVQRAGFILRSIDSSDAESPYWMSSDISYRPRFKATVTGWIPFELVFKSPQTSAIQFRGDIHTRGQRWPKGEHADKRPEDVWIDGRLLPLAEQGVQIITAAFNCLT